MLSHTGDPNKGLCDWYKNKKENDDDADVVNEAVYENREKPKGWGVLKSKVNSKTNATQG